MLDFMEGFELLFAILKLLCGLLGFQMVIFLCDFWNVLCMEYFHICC